MQPEALTVRQAMQATGLSRRTIGRMLNDGRLVGAYKSGQEWRIPQAALDALNESTTTSTTPDIDDSELSWRERALVAEAKLEATERTVDMLQTTLTAMTATLEIANMQANDETAPTPQDSSQAVVHVMNADAVARRRWWQRRR